MRILIIEDNVIIAEHLKEIILGFNAFSIKLAHSKSEGLEFISLFEPDLVLLDIHLENQQTGIELALTLNETYKIPFIYITAQADIKTIDAAIATKPLTYILKPYLASNIYSSIMLARQRLVTERIEIKDGTSTFYLDSNKIKYIKAEGNYLKVFHNDKNVVIRKTLKQIEEILNSSNFVQINRSFIINTNFIEKIVKDKVCIDSIEIPISSKYDQNLKNVLN